MASNLNPNCAYYFFKEGIRPMWEDSTNKAGGRWVINCMKKNFKAIDNYWMELVRFSIHRTDHTLFGANHRPFLLLTLFSCWR